MDIERLRVLAESSGHENPLIGLEAMRGVRAEVERHEAALVRRARNAGESWAAIAAVLGVSRQAVHQKYGRSGSRRERRG